MASKTYIAVADRAPGEIAYSITFPSFPGLTSVAETLRGVMRQAHDALATMVDDMNADGEVLPLSVEDGADDPRLPSDLHNPVLLMVSIEVQTRGERANVSRNEGLHSL